MRQVLGFVRRHPLWMGFLSAVLPLIVLLGLQYRWLARLQSMSALAHRAALANYIEAVGSKTRYFYLANAERALNLPASLFNTGTVHKAAAYWEKKPIDGVRRLFVVDYSHEPFGHFMAYNPATHSLEQLPASAEAMAIIMACAPWQVQTYRGGIGDATLRVDERDTENRIILNPILDDAERLVGVAGMILDDGYFESVLLPEAIQAALPEFLPGANRGDVVVTVRDGRGGVVFATGKGTGHAPVVAENLPFAFTDWRVEIHSGSYAPEQWARANFAYNMMLALLLAAVLVAGIALALRAANRAMRLSQMKSDFVSNVSHELRTPLASIRVFAEFLRLGRTQSPDKVREYGEYIDVESRRLSRLIDNILDFSRIESGRKTYRFGRTDLREVVASVLHTFDVRLRQDGFRVCFDAEGWDDATLHADPDAIGQAVANLIDNAIKYSGDGRAITVRLARQGGDAVLAVSDDGIGIEHDEQAKIFERFHRVGTGLVHDVKGSGLGLSIVQHVVSAHRGRISVESEPGRGSTFTIRLPIGPGGEAGTEAPPAPGPSPQAAGSAAPRSSPPAAGGGRG